MKYGIKHNAGIIQLLSEFKDNIVPVGFVELTKSKYDGFITKMKVNPFYTFNPATVEIEQNVSQLAAAQNNTLKSEYRAKLMELSNELDLQTRLGESTTATQSEFDTAKANYEALSTSPPP